MLLGIGFAAALGVPLSAAGDPRTDYVLNCQGCHGPDGTGAPGAVPTFRGSVGKFLRVPGGREYLVQVPGTSQSELSDARTAVLLNWLLREFSSAEVPVDFVPYDEAEVARLRRPPLVDVITVRRRLTEEIQKTEARSQKPEAAVRSQKPE